MHEARIGCKGRRVKPWAALVSFTCNNVTKKEAAMSSRDHIIARTVEPPQAAPAALAREALLELIAELPVKERRLELAGISTAILEGGSGAPVVLLHGPMGCAAHWKGVIPELAATHRVVVPDLPGHG